MLALVITTPHQRYRQHHPDHRARVLLASLPTVDRQMLQADDEQTFQLTTQQRYVHSERYVRQLAERHGFETVKMLRHAIREDQREPIAGLYFYLFKA